ncbi:MAG: hypothetical protein R3279_01180 [Putridiphycobacter sp.]|nr:hypothetical protein [Putridiphycobacter sp.]
MKKKRRIFQGLNEAVLEANIAIFKEELGDRFINKTMLSNNPEYQIEVEYWEEDKK